MFMQRKQWQTCGRVGVILLWVGLAGSSLSFAEPEDASVYWQESTQGLGQEIVDDPVLVQLLFAMPPDVMEEVETPVRPARQPKGWLGITMQEGPPLFPKGADDLAPTIEVLEVFPHSSAERAGLLPGDIILATHGEQLSIGKENSLMMNFNRRVQDTGAGDILRLKIKRGGREMELPVELFPKPTTPVFINPPGWKRRICRIPSCIVFSDPKTGWRITRPRSRKCANAPPRR